MPIATITSEVHKNSVVPTGLETFAPPQPSSELLGYCRMSLRDNGDASPRLKLNHFAPQNLPFPSRFVHRPAADAN
jgi:hypothetical protein